MSANATVQDLLDAALPAMAPLAMTAAADGQSWQFSHEAELFFTLRHDTESDTLSFLAPVGEPEGGAVTSVYEKLLVFSNQWQETGGLRFGLDQNSDELMLIYDRPLERTHSEQFIDIAANLIEQRNAWQGFISNAQDDTPPPEPAPFDPGMMGGGFIRG